MLDAAIVLAGGRSSRMGRAKASLDWEGAPLLSRTVATLGAVADRVVVVRSPGQALPPLPVAVTVVEDARPGRGPLEGLLAGLRSLEPLTRSPSSARRTCRCSAPVSRSASPRCCDRGTPPPFRRSAGSSIPSPGLTARAWRAGSPTGLKAAASA